MQRVWLGLGIAALFCSCGGRDEDSSNATTTESLRSVPSPAEPREARVPPPPQAPPPPPAEPVQIGPYTADIGRDCDGLPYLDLETLDGLCVGLAVHRETPPIAAARGRFRPRAALADPVATDRVWVVDAGARRPRAGRVWRLTRQPDGHWEPEAVLRRLSRPHGLRLGPDGRLYVGDIAQIVRFDPRAAEVSTTLEVVVDDLPTDLPSGERIRFHPLTSFVFTPEWDLIVNMGSGTDHCAESLPADRCGDEDRHTAALWRYAYQGEGRWSRHPQHIAHGLRNSVALAVHSSGTILQAENGTDFREEDRPHEELNIIEPGMHYGWPYCYDRDQRDPRWLHSSFQCDPTVNPQYRAPYLLLPPHGAPLSMLYYTADRFTSLTGHLLISLHGYRTPGHRVLAYAVNERGIPASDAEPREVIAGWARGDHGPRGTPVELTQAPDGSMWLVEDNNGTVLRISTDQYAAHRNVAANSEQAQRLVADIDFRRVHQRVLVPRCGPCHTFIRGNPDDALNSLHLEGWLGEVEGVTLIAQRIAPDATRPMPPDRPLTRAERVSLARWLNGLREN